MKYELTIIEKTKGNDEWQLEEYAVELYENWEEVLRAISILIPKGYLYELKIIE
jgi:hypothetical protein